MADPALDQWRLLAINALIGRVSNHPKLGDGWIVTSVVEELDRATKRARTLSRWYDLLDEIPPDEPLPDVAHDLLLSVLSRRVTIALEDIPKLFALVEGLCAPPGKPQ